MTTEKTIVCLKWGNTLYSPEWVNRLYRGVKRHLTPPFNFVCFTDETAGLDPGILIPYLLNQLYRGSGGSSPSCTQMPVSAAPACF